MRFSENPRTHFVALSTGVRNQGTPVCSLTFRGRTHEPGVPLYRFLSDKRAQIVCEGLDQIFEHDCLDDFMHLRCQVSRRSLIFADVRV